MDQLQTPKLLRATEITQIEKTLRAQGFLKIAGVDEAGRGPLAGPVVAAACVFPDGLYIEGIDDSKKLSARKRKSLFALLTSNPSIEYGIGIVEAERIDAINILQATLLAMTEAISKLPYTPDLVLVDGNKTPPLKIPCRALVKGDTLAQSIMGASIIAKETRDLIMIKYDQQYPMYGFAAHKGYPTLSHFNALQQWGRCPIHRKSFKSFLLDRF